MRWSKGFLDWLSELRPRQMLMISAVAALVMFGIMYFAFTKLTRVEEEVVSHETPEVVTRSVVVAKSDIGAQTILKREMLELKELPEDMVPTNAVSDAGAVINRTTKAMIFSGDVITEQKIYGSNEPTGFVGSIPKDCRAISVSVNDVTGVAGFAKPGDRVDVVLVEKGDGIATSTILLQNVLLLSINNNMGVKKTPSSEGEQQLNPSTEAIDNPTIATLALKPDEGLQLVSASKLGEIYLMLRPFRPSDSYVDASDYTLESYRPSRTVKSEAPSTSTPSTPSTSTTPTTPRASVPPTSTAPIVEPKVPFNPSALPELQSKPEAKTEPQSKSEPEKPKTFEIIYGDDPDEEEAKK